MKSLNLVAPIKWNAPLNRGLLRWWLCLPTRHGGSIWRDLTRKNDIVITNGVPLQAPNRPSGFGSYSFDGSGDYGQTAAAVDLTAVTKFTLAFWGYFSNGSTTNQITFESSAASSANSNTIYFNHRQATAVTQVRLRGTLNSDATFPYPSIGAWHHYVWTIDIALGGQPHVVYVDGVQQTLTYASSLQNATDFGNHVWNFASRNGSSFFSSVRLDDIRMFNVIKSPSEALQIYRSSRIGSPNELRRLKNLQFSPRTNAVLTSPACYRRRRSA